MKRKLCTAVLTILMLFTLMPTVFAGNSGTCGDNLTWTLNGGVLTISGTGPMDNYFRCYAPWNTQIDGFVDTSITKVVIDDGVTSIGNYAFFYCSKLASVDIPDSVTSIGDNAFCACSNLTSIDLPDSVTSIGQYAFSSCSNLTSIDLSDRLTSIDAHTFNNCTRLTSIEIPDSVTSIGQYAFRYCVGLTSVKLPAELTTIGNHAFEFCGLTGISFPDGLTTIGEDAFMSCCGLTSIKIPNSVTSIGRYAFYGCTSLNSVKLPDGLISIGADAFYGCSNLTSIALPDSLTSIEQRTFYDCTSLTSVKLPNSLTSIGNSAFYNCSSLASIACPDGLTNIGNSVFYGCSSLTSIELPNSVTSIGSWAFYDCSNLADVYYSGTVEQWNSTTINGQNDCLTGATIHFGTQSSQGHTHSWDDGTVTKAPTATESGVKTFTCKSCGKTKTETIAALGCPFTDLKNPSSYYDAVLWAVDKGITKGTSATEFSPKAECTRAQIVTFLWRYAGSPEPKSMKHNFVDIVKGSSYYKAVIWAVEKGITTGTDATHFSPKEPCTRAQIVTFLWRYAGKPQPSSQSHNFTDIVKGSSYYDAVLWAVEKGITTGADTTHFAPKEPCTRAQGMTFLYRYNNTK